MRSFNYYPENAEVEVKGLVVRLTKGLKSKQTLFDSLALSLKFPTYFGCNWDALEECLGDLSWLGDDHISIWHEDIPLQNSLSEAKTYLEILRDLLVDQNNRQIEIFFPEYAKKEVQDLLARDA